MKFIKTQLNAQHILLIAGDFLLATVSVYMGIYIRFLSDPRVSLQSYYKLMPGALIFSIFVVFMCFFVDVYKLKNRLDTREVFLRLFIANVMAVLGLGMFYYFFPSVKLWRSILIFSICINYLLQIVWYFVYDLFSNLPVAARRVLILGTGPIAQTMGDLLLKSKNGLALAGYVNCVGESIHVPKDNVVGDGDSLLDVALKEKAQQIVVSLSERRGTFPVREVLNCKLQGIDIVDGPSFYEMMTGKLLIENMNPSHLIFSEGFRITLARRYVKRMLDVIFASLGLLFSLPFFIIVPLVIKFDSNGPVLFKQKRVGEGERQFTLFKFRTMVDGAEKSTGPVWSKTGDRRITQVGKFLRKTRLDEIPQLFNVFRGDMSFIGPRPERPFFVESLKKQIPYYSERHCIKPGITGWAQVRYEYGDSIEDAIEKLRFDLYYVKYQSLALDLLIMLDTIKVILFGKGGR